MNKQPPHIEISINPIITDRSLPIILESYQIIQGLWSLIDKTKDDNFNQELNFPDTFTVKIATAPVHNFDEQKTRTRNWILRAWSKELARAIEVAFLAAQETIGLLDHISQTTICSKQKVKEQIEAIIHKNKSYNQNQTEKIPTKQMIKGVLNRLGMADSYRDLIFSIFTCRNILSHSDAIIKERHCQAGGMLVLKLLSSKIKIQNQKVTQQFYEAQFKKDIKLNLNLEQVHDLSATCLWATKQLQFSLGKYIERKTDLQTTTL